jgi:small neutral amino acid transporter SnatA (MarC family)
MWIVVALVLRLLVAPPERCPDVSEDDLRSSATEAVSWFERNQQADGRWLYRYDVDADADLGGYNVVRHAGVTMSLYQAHAAGYDGALRLADRGTRYALDNLVRHRGWAAFEPGTGRISAGATGLLVAGLAERRAATGQRRHDDVLTDMGRFLLEMVEPRGSVAAAWDPVTEAPVPGEYSPFFTGEIYWALALLHQEFPDQGWDEPARRIGRYLATERDDAEGWFPDISDHWAAYGMSVEATLAADGSPPLDEAQVRYAERQSDLAGIQTRWESQRTNGWPNWWLRGRQTLGAGLGTLGESLTGLWLVAATDDRLESLEDPLAARARCVAGMLVDRQVSPDDAAATPDPDRSRGAWFQFGVTQMDDQQHALSAVVLSEPILASQPSQVDRPWGDGAAWWLVLSALVLAINPLRAAGAMAVGMPAVVRRDRIRAVVAGGAAAAAALAALAWWSGPLLDVLDTSAPTVRIGAGLVLLLASAVDLVRRAPSVEPSVDGRLALLVPVAVPLLLRPAAAVLAISAGADRGVATVLMGAALAAAVLLALAASAVGRSAGGRTVVPWLARVAAAAGVVIGVVLAVDGVFDV